MWRSMFVPETIYRCSPFEADGQNAFGQIQTPSNELNWASHTTNFSWTWLTNFGLSHEKFDVWPRPNYVICLTGKRGPTGEGPMSPVWILKCLVSVFINACRLLSALLSLSQFGRGRLSLVAISFHVLSLLFGPCRLPEFTLAGPGKTGHVGLLQRWSQILIFQLDRKIWFLAKILEFWAEWNAPKT